MKTFNKYEDLYNFLRDNQSLLGDSHPLRTFFNDCQVVYHSTCCANKKGKYVTRARTGYETIARKLSVETKVQLLEKIEESILLLKQDGEEVGRIE